MTKILFVDDEFINRELFSINLSKTYNVITADDGPAALQVLEENPDIKVIFSDMRMPQMNGIDFVKEAKRKFQDLKCYILTGFDISTEIQQALNENLIVKYFRKPFNMNLIRSEIEKNI
ncbi:response regulator [Carboxylicivirga caseinilyticus]|uniref:response regulator n=1 Tax=Carboxylicivirga caseinilyticus TaxID=3417572 RepID=UPI002AA83710|nr:response regulator [uncultured Carboxylicivirga sp.]MCU4163497.1 response regulator [Marinilabiliaceae bacterium A049]